MSAEDIEKKSLEAQAAQWGRTVWLTEQVANERLKDQSQVKTMVWIMDEVGPFPQRESVSEFARRCCLSNPVMYVFPDETGAKIFVRDKFEPLLRKKESNKNMKKLFKKIKRIFVRPSIRFYIKKTKLQGGYYLKAIGANNSNTLNQNNNMA